MKKTAFEEFMINNLRMTADNKYIEIIRFVNNTLVQLFWKIGTILREDTSNNSHVKYGSDILNHISDKLEAIFGGYMGISQLKLMKEFSKRYNSENIDEIFDFPDWSEITLLLNNISEDISSMTSSIEHKFESNIYYSNIGSVYFIGKEKGKFRKLLEPKETFSHYTYDFPFKMFDCNLLNKILNEILRAQVSLNHVVNVFFNSLLWEIGEGILKYSSYFEESISDSTIECCVKELNESFPSVFNKKQLLYCIKLVKYYPDPVEFWNISDIVSWPYLKVLLTIKDKDKHVYIANQLLVEKISLLTFKKNVSKSFLDKNVDGDITFKEFNHKIVKITIQEEKQNSLIGYHYEKTNRNIEYQRVLNCNIFKNKELLRFLKHK